MHFLSSYQVVSPALKEKAEHDHVSCSLILSTLRVLHFLCLQPFLFLRGNDNPWDAGVSGAGKGGTQGS